MTAKLQSRRVGRKNAPQLSAKRLKMNQEPDLLELARRQKSQELSKKIEEMLNKEGYQLSAILVPTHNALVAMPTIEPKNDSSHPNSK
jgi:hypothetical protein